ncbi:L-asparagine oxygenase [Streptomyces vinaceus]|uniref:L-asparagine oxygenase n=1 Tax=Streptomyces vinaceus TaxID=1960 RepID=A0A5J6JDH5_STRVI|nr:clavaminate synthase family protein [Streptomyces vinaceus]QEV48575.1 L-asparagine oxygenase [Streptomyces vinaceus]GHE35594.1 L-asparagine oxygenase [Streptomyces vinaceus]
MSKTAQAAPAEAVRAIPAKAAAEIADVSLRLVSEADRIDDAAWVAAARSAWAELPAVYRREIGSFRRHSGPSGAVVVRGLPVDEQSLPATPMAGGSVQRAPTAAAALLVMTACGLGDPAAFLAEKSGALVQDVVPVPGQEYFQGNAGSVDLMMHNENAFHEHRPDFVMLLCLRPDHEGVAGLSTASIREALPKLSDRAVDCLWQPEFSTQPPPSFGSPEDGPVRHAVLTGTPEDPDIQVDFAATTGLTPAAREALAELSDGLVAVARTVRLRAGDLAIVDNRVCLHGRTAFRPRYDGRDRWVQRTFAMADLRRSRAFRTDDGYVLVR